MVFIMNTNFGNVTPLKSKPRRYYFHCTDNAKLPLRSQKNGFIHLGVYVLYGNVLSKENISV